MPASARPMLGLCLGFAGAARHRSEGKEPVSALACSICLGGISDRMDSTNDGPIRKRRLWATTKFNLSMPFREGVGPACWKPFAPLLLAAIRNPT